MTTPAPLPDPWEPFTTLTELAVWVQLPEIPEDQVQFANIVLGATAVVIRDKGSKYWTRTTIPARVKLLADLKAKNFFEHPTGAVSETTGPISERYLDEVVQQLQLTEAEELLVAGYAGDDGDPTTDDGIVGLWVLSTTRGPLETHQNEGKGVDYVPWYRQGSKLFPYYASGTWGAPLE